MANDNTGKNTPPYVSYKTLNNFLEGLRQGIPSHIDRSVLPTLSGSSQAQLLTALKALDLISEDGTVTELLAELVHADNQERRDLWKKILQHTYPYFFEDFDLSTAPPSQFEQRLRDQGGVSGTTVRKCVIFFISAASEAGIPLSNFIKQLVKRRTPNTNGSKPKSKKPTNGQTNGETADIDDDNLEESESDNGITQSTSARASTSSNSKLQEHREWKQKLLEMRLEKLPPFNPEWDSEVQRVWIETLNRLSSLEDLGI